MVSFAAQVGLLLGKTGKQTIRHPLSLCCQACCPVIFLSLLSVLALLGKTTYYSDHVTTFETGISSYSVEDLQSHCNNKFTPNQGDPGKVAVVGPVHVREEFISYAIQRLNSTTDPVPRSCFVEFDSDGALDGYVTDADYLNKPYLVRSAISLSALPTRGQPFEYTIRGNATEDGSLATRFPTDTTTRSQGGQGFSPQPGDYSDSLFAALQILAEEWALGQQAPAGVRAVADDETMAALASVPAAERARHPLLRRAPEGADAFAFRADAPAGSAQHRWQTSVRSSLSAGASGSGSLLGDVHAAMFPQFHYHVNDVYGAVTTVFSFLFIVLLCAPVAMQIRGMVLERETKVREGLLMFGVHEMAPTVAWFVTYTTIWFAISLGSTVTTFKFFAHSDLGFVFLMFFIYGLSTIQFAYFLHGFFDRSRTGAVLGSMLFIVSFFPSFSVGSASTGVQTLAALLPNTAFGLALKKVAAFEGDGVGLSASTVGIVRDDSSVSQLFAMLLVDTLLYFLLGFYVERVWPHDYGTRLHPLFFLRPDFWGCARERAPQRGDFSNVELQNVDGDALTQGAPQLHELDPTSFEEPGADSRQKDAQDRCIRVNRLRRTFATPDGEKVAVDDLSITMYEGQIFALLGHNGAGKTTTISMLSGMLAASGGSATVFGCDLSNEMSKIRRFLGVCPQHDVLFDDLTVREHLELFAAFKDVPKDARAAAIDSSIAEVGLTEKVNALSKTLSGGQKRKLSVAIALLGDSKVVFLDEPTSGMDPYSRRSTWSLIQRHREGRIIILTTHFMDEADLLGDRIGIMAEGKMRCCGSSMFLKRQFGVGYNLTMIKEPRCDADRVKAAVTRHVAAATLLSNVGSEIAFQLPLGATASFPALLEDLDTSKSSIGIEDYGLSVTTMEEVFLKVAEGGDKQEIEMTRNLSQRLSQDAASRSSAAKSGAASASGAAENRFRPQQQDAEFDILNVSQSQNFFLIHFAALFLKRARYAWRDLKMACFQIMIPVVGVLAALLLLKAATVTDQPALAIDAKTLNPLVASEYNHGTYFPVLGSVNTTFAADISTIETLLTNYEGGDAGIFAKALPLAAINDDPASTCALVSGPGSTPDKSKQFVLPPFSKAALPNSVCDAIASSAYLGMSSRAAYASTTLQNRLLRLRAQFESSVYAGLHVTALDLQSDAATVVVHFNSTTNIALPLAVNTFSNMLLATMAKAPGASLPSKISLTAHPLPVTAGVRAAVGGGTSLIASLLIIIVFAFIPAAQAIFVVKERETNVKHQQLISGVSIPAYWLSTFAWDVANYCIPFAATLIMFQLFNLDQFTKSETYGSVVALLAGYGLATASFTYLTSFVFRSHTVAMAVTLLVNVFMLVLVIASYVMSLLDATCHVNTILTYFYALTPGYNLGIGLINLSLFEFFGARYNCNMYLPQDVTAGDWKITGMQTLYLYVTAFVYLALTIALDVVLSTPSIRRGIIPEPFAARVAHDKDDDVAAEERRVEQGGAAGDAVVVDRLRKVYRGGKVAVRELSFGIPKGEVFGFLGINGAGKTTTLKILSGDIVPSEGKAWLGGLDIMTQQIEVRRLLGYCPQFSALLELLTVREHLELFAKIKGFSGSVLPRLVSAKIREMDLSDFENKQAGSLSGGNKRKLSVAIATIGNPQILFLDEPSTGVDPVSRRFMWDVISRMVTERRECSAILTSHSMEEVQALCTRVGIMVGGRLRCLGSIQHLKRKFGHGLMAEIKLEDPPEDHLDTLVAAGRGAAGGDLVSRETLPLVCRAMGDERRVQLFSPQGTAWLLDAAIAKGGAVGVDQVAAWWAEENLAASLDGWVRATFHGSSLLERHGQYLRFRITPGKRSLAAVFSLMESARAELNVREYSLSQTSLEQIFNMFAGQQEEERGAVRGMEQVDTMLAPTPTPTPAPAGAAAGGKAYGGSGQYMAM